MPGRTLVPAPAAPRPSPHPMICGIVLAAGRSRRMGEPKALLPAGDGTFLRRVARALAEGGCTPVVVVVGAGEEAERIVEEAEREGAGVAVSADPEAEQVDSLRAGLRALPPGAEAAVVTPVDVPDVSAALVRRLVEGFRRTRAPVAVPAAGGRHGHPVLFSRAVFPELLSGGLAEGARSVVHRHRDALLEVEVERLPPDLDTPGEYRRWLEGT
jgi:molybdenum cofactor cytidylyltransferase